MHAASPSHFIHISPLTPRLLFQNRVSVQKSQKPVKRRQLTESKDPLVLRFLDHSVCVYFLSGLYACFEVTCGAGSEHSTDITCRIPGVAAAVVAVLVTADAHSTSKKRAEHWHRTALVFDSRSHLNVVQICWNWATFLFIYIFLTGVVILWGNDC